MARFIRTTFEPTKTIEVSEDEYLFLLRLGLIFDPEAPPAADAIFTPLEASEILRIAIGTAFDDDTTDGFFTPSQFPGSRLPTVDPETGALPPKSIGFFDERYDGRYPQFDKVTGEAPPLIRDAFGIRGGFVNVLDFGPAVGVGYVVGSGGNDTLAFQAAFTEAGKKGRNVQVPTGRYLAGNLDAPSGVRLIGVGGPISRFGPVPGKPVKPIEIVTPSAAYAYILRLAGAASGVENIHLDANGFATVPLITSGFETTINSVRMMNSTGIGFDVQKANNARWNNLYVDNCGAVDQPAVKVWSKAGVGSAAETNSVAIYGLTIERQPNVALEVAWGTTGDYWTEWLKIVDLHVEAPVDNGGTANVDPLVRIGNVRNVSLFAPMIYGGPGLLLQHNQVVNRGIGNGGIRLFGGSLLGSDTSNGVPATPRLVQLTAGDDISFEGVVMMRYTGQAIGIDAAYGAKVYVSPSTTFTGAAISDARTGATPVLHRGNITLTDHFLGNGTFATVVNSPAVGTSPPAAAINGNDIAGRVFLGTGSATSAGILATVTFAKPFGVEPTVVISAGTLAAASLGLYVSVTTTGFTIRCATAPAAALAANSIQVKYMVVGLNS